MGITILTFSLTKALPGDPALSLVGERASPEVIASIRAKLNADKNVQCQNSQINWNVKLLANIPAAYKRATTQSYKVATGQGVQCSSCHDPHNGSGVPATSDFFLRGNLTGNDTTYLCLKCHKK